VNREKGVSSLALVLMLLVLGSLLLQGMSQQDRSFASRVSMESQSLRRQAIVQSALAWGKMHSWQTQPAVQCSQYAGTDARVCLRLLADNEALLIAGYEGVSLWRTGEVINGNIVFSPCGWSDFCPLKEGGVMSASLKNQQGFSLPEVMLAMVLMVVIVTALSGFQRTLMNSLASRNQYQQLWRHGWQQTQLRAISPPANWQVNRMQTSQAGCVSISVTLVSPGGREGEMTRLHCPNRQ